MLKIREVVRMLLTTDLSDREIAAAASVARNTVIRYGGICAERSYQWADLEGLSDTDFDAKFNAALNRMTRKRMPDLPGIHAELQKKGVDLTLLWEEYRLESPHDAMSYSQFTHHYRTYVGSLDRVMRQTHHPGRKLFVDFSGLRPKIVDQDSGVESYVELFVGVLGYSNYTFATAVPSQKSADWVDAHNKMYAFFGGATEIVVPDNLKAAVDKPGVDPIINRTYRELTNHYTTTPIPARSYRARDKASVELGVKLCQKFILARIRHMKFFSIGELNAEIAKLVAALNARPFKRMPGSRLERFESVERAMLPLAEN
jgi:transposase